VRLSSRPQQLSRAFRQQEPATVRRWVMLRKRCSAMWWLSLCVLRRGEGILGLHAATDQSARLVGTFAWIKHSRAGFQTSVHTRSCR
jgi:hypothetical protein